MFGILLLLITIIKCGVSLVVDCTYEKDGVIYDFSPLLSRDYKDIFRFYGDSATDAESTLYWYNIICGNITSTPDVPSCSDNSVRSSLAPVLPLGYCPTDAITNNSCSEPYVNITTPVAAFQVENNLCYRLHDGVTPPTVSLVNESNPLSGVHFRYINGDFCAVNNVNRDSNIIIFCNNSNFNASYIAFENPICTYVLQISSVFGCPAACINYDTNEVCTNHGECVYDNNGMHCSCDEGWGNDLCNTTSELSPNSTTEIIDSPSGGNKKDKEKKWPRWLGILLACLAGAFLCCCLAALLALLMAKKKGSGRNYNNVGHAHPTPVTRNEYVPTRQEEI